ncbi:hypothetical protein [Paracoccus sp. FO-3]|uniref:hypothetical protein n=1 Tax=Paracoccus sp. FO-3 TaxID=1335059 RepID=UPI0015E32FFD|nr:hypothetical protein [Paracoccus sp. FO-3]
MRISDVPAALDRMEVSAAETRACLDAIDRRLRQQAEAETIIHRPKSRYFHRQMSRWTGSDEREYQRILAALMERAGAEIDRLCRRLARQQAAILAMRRKYRVNEARPQASSRGWQATEEEEGGGVRGG